MAAPTFVPPTPAAKSQSRKEAKIPAPAKTLVCWGCGGAHSLRDCSVTAEADKKGIADKRISAWRDKDKGKDVPIKQKVLHVPPSSRRPKGASPGEGYCEATIPGTPLSVTLFALLEPSLPSPSWPGFPLLPVSLWH